MDTEGLDSEGSGRGDGDFARGGKGAEAQLRRALMSLRHSLHLSRSLHDGDALTMTPSGKRHKYDDR